MGVPQGGGGAPMVFQTMAGGAPPVIVIPTGPEQMQQGGYDEEYREAARGRPVMGQTNRRHITPRARPMSPRRQDSAFGGGPVAASTKITIRKLT